MTKKYGESENVPIEFLPEVEDNFENFTENITIPAGTIIQGNNYRTLTTSQPIKVSVCKSEGVFTANILEMMTPGTGKTAEEAVQDLKTTLFDQYHHLHSIKDKLAGMAESTLQMLQRILTIETEPE